MSAAMEVLPPDGRLCKPRRPLPRGTVDCHAHIVDQLERWIPRDAMREPLFATNAARLYRF